jgi:stress response protein YsnF
MQNPTDILEVVAESAVVEKRDVVTGKVRVKTLTEIDHEMVSAVLSEENVTVNRVPVNRYIDSAPDLRVENGVTIIPVVEEVLVVEKRLVLREEIHVRRSVTHHTVEDSVDLRRQRVEVQRDGEESQPIEEDK